MRKILLVFLVFMMHVAELITSNFGPDRPNDPRMARLSDQARCTRRYTPGTCAQSVAVVWTFVFLRQNCTERLGCPSASRTNRFMTYRRCMHRCRPLAALYSQVLASAGISGNHSAWPVLMRDIRRREDLSLEDLEPPQRDPEPEYDDTLGDLPLVNPLGDKEKVVTGLEDVLPPDIDNIGSDHILNPDDIFHDAFGTN